MKYYLVYLDKYYRSTILMAHNATEALEIVKRSKDEWPEIMLGHELNVSDTIPHKTKE